MNRQSTLQKEQIIVAEFNKLMRSGKDYSANYMYRAVGAKCFFLNEGTIGNIIRKHYNEQITEDMRIFAKEISSLAFIEKMKLFSVKFKKCSRETRLILRYLR